MKRCTWAASGATPCSPATWRASLTRVAVIGAGSKGEFREEDQICCAWIAAGL